MATTPLPYLACRKSPDESQSFDGKIIKFGYYLNFGAEINTTRARGGEGEGEGEEGWGEKGSGELGGGGGCRMPATKIRGADSQSSYAVPYLAAAVLYALICSLPALLCSSICTHLQLTCTPLLFYLHSSATYVHSSATYVH